jgi:hypothetical protein
VSAVGIVAKRLRVRPAAMAGAALVSLGILGAGLPAAAGSALSRGPDRPAASPPATASAYSAADPCTPTVPPKGGSSGMVPSPGAARSGSKRSLTVTGPTGPYTSEETTYCGTLTLPGKPTVQPLSVEVNGKVVATATAGVDRSWHTWLLLTPAKSAVIRVAWQLGKAGQLVSRPLTVHPNSAPDTRPTSLTLIAKALAAHRISRQTALVDGVFALLAPDNLPASLTGTRPITELDDSGVIDAVDAGWRTLDPRQRGAVLPYLGPYKFPRGAVPGIGQTGPARIRAAGKPDGYVLPRLECNRHFSYQGQVSYIPPFDATVPPGWAYIDTAHFRIWYATRNLPFTNAAQSQATAQYLASEVETVYDKETGLFGRTPPSDGDEKCNGGDDAIDIYVWRSSFLTAGLTLSYAPSSCQNTPSYITIAPDFANNPVIAEYVLAHEFFHTIELSYTPKGQYCLPYGWLGEATATWIVDYVYPENPCVYHNAIPYFEYNGDYRASLDVGVQNGYGHPGYDDYIYLLFLAHQFYPQVIRDIWDNSTNLDPRHAINAAVPGGIAESWHLFALDNWNRPPLDDYMKWDDFRYNLPDNRPYQLDLDGQHSKVLEISDNRYGADLAALSSDYLYFTVTDGNVAQIKFTNYGFAKPPGSGVKLNVLLELGDGKFVQQDWTPGAEKTFCRDKAGEDVTAVLLMYSNGGIDGPARWLGPDFKVRYSDACVPTGYTGTVTSTLVTSDGAGDMTQVAKVKANFSYDQAVSDPDLNQFLYNTTGGKAKVSVSGTSGQCTISGSGSFAVPAWIPPILDGPGGQITFDNGLAPKAAFSGNGSFTGAPPFTETITCNGQTVTGNYYPAGDWWQTDLPNGTPTGKIRKGQILSGTLTTSAPDETMTWTWNFKPIFGP